MKVFFAKNIFESNKFCYFYSKFINFSFTTISKNEKNKSRTTQKDFLRFFVGFPFALYIFYDTLWTTFKQEKRSIIFEIIIVLNAKIQTLHAAIVMFQVFLYRDEYLKILTLLHMIDIKVRKNFPIKNISRFIKFLH